jgi:NTP pyrophosphatase (non-canonical NTP hydrolase)
VIDNDGRFRLAFFQSEVGEWSRRNFGDQPSTNPLLGLTEEVGELSHAHLKGLQGIRHTPAEIREMKVDAVADILVYLADYCEREGIDLEGAVMPTWTKVRSRDWAKNPMGAGHHDENQG